MKIILNLLCVSVATVFVSAQNRECDSFTWQCKNGDCIDSTDLCDGVVNCSDKSDESVENCISNQCPKYAFRCLYGACVRGNAECNGKKECADDSDEMTAKCPSIIHAAFTQGNCQKWEFKCESRECISEDSLCDGVRDCKDGSDEIIEHCAARPCPTFAFRCGYGACISGRSRCDGKKDCADGSDENYLLCNYTNPYVKPTTATQKPVNVPKPSGDSCQIDEIPENGDVYLESDLKTKLPYRHIVDNYSTVKYKCIQNHIIVGSSSNFCAAGKWTSPTPQCQPYCNPREINTVTIGATCYRTVNNTNAGVWCHVPAMPGTIATIHCQTGYESPLTINQISHCGDDGRWNPPPTQCLQICGQESAEGTPYIVGGEPVNITKVPWHVGIYRKIRADGPFEQQCGGTILNAKAIVTAIHCFWDPYERKPHPEIQFSIAVGKVNRDYNAQEALKTQVFGVEKIHYPEGYTDIIAYYAQDIAVVILNGFIEFSSYVMPVCLPYGLKYEDKIVHSGWNGRVAGWGLEQSGGKPSPILKVIDLPTISRADCVNTSDVLFQPYVTSDKFCAGYLTGVSVCQGDSGGGLVIPKNINGKNTYFLRGVVSIGANKANSCDNDKYATFTNIAFHTDFIQQFDIPPK